MSNKNEVNFRFGSNEYRNYFRTDYVEKDAGKIFLGIKNGNVYAVCIFIYLSSIMATIFYQIGGLNKNQMMLIPLYFVILNLIEYVLHRYPMHKKTKGLEFLFDHVTVHHNFYNNEKFYYENSRDFMAVFLPFLYSIFISGLILSISSVVYFISDLNNALFFGLVSYGYYMLYEVMHFCSHTKKDSFVKKIPFMAYLSQFHLDHHQAKHMSKINFNITFPIFDFILNTNLKKSKREEIATEVELIPVDEIN